MFSAFIAIQMLSVIGQLATTIFQLDVVSEFHWNLNSLNFSHFNQWHQDIFNNKINSQAIQQMSLRLFVTLISLTVSGTNLFCYCFFGRKTTSYYLMFGDCLYESNWMNLPNALQKCFPLMIAHAQIPLTYHGYGLVHLDLNTFLRVNLFSFQFLIILLLW